MAEKYGFYTEEYNNDDSIETLMTGDGKTLFSDISFPDGTQSIAFSYGMGEGVGVIVEHEDNTKPSDVGVKWQVKFESQGSIDAMIQALLRVKNNMAEHDAKNGG
jgi:hypothetical protein